MSDRLSDYDYVLPEGLIAQVPLEDRAASRMLCLNRASGAIRHARFREIAEFLAPGDTLVVNDARVSALRLLGTRPSGGRIEALLLRQIGADQFIALTKPARKLTVGSALDFGGLEATVVAVGDHGERTLAFEPVDNLLDRLRTVGAAPLPPYIHERLDDPERYQTVYAKAVGSAAAPTAGLHFTPEILAAVREKGVDIVQVTLDVGLDTFRPVEVEDTSQHVMHGERVELTEASADRLNAARGRVIAVGTTAVRALESFAIGPRRVRAGAMETRLFIRPGFQFQVVDGLLTNFHLPKTTLLMMISALASREVIFEAYSAAIAERYRFLSFGDCMLIL